MIQHIRILSAVFLASLLWCVKSKAQEAIVSSPEAVISRAEIGTRFTLSRDGKYFFYEPGDLPIRNRNVIHVVDRATKKAVVEMPSTLSGVLFTPDSKHFACTRIVDGFKGTRDEGYLAQRCDVYDLPGGKLLRSITLPPKDYMAGLIVGNVRVFAPLRSGGAKVYDLATGKEVGHIRHPRLFNLNVLSADGKWLLVNDKANELWLFETKPGGVSRRIYAHKTYVHAIAISADGKYCASSEPEAALRVFSCASGIEKAGMVYGKPFSPCREMTFAGDGSTLVLWIDSNDPKWERLPDGYRRWQPRFWDWDGAKPPVVLLSPVADSDKLDKKPNWLFLPGAITGDGTGFLALGRSRKSLMWFDLKGKKPGPMPEAKE